MGGEGCTDQRAAGLNENWKVWARYIWSNSGEYFGFRGFQNGDIYGKKPAGKGSMTIVSFF